MAKSNSSTPAKQKKSKSDFPLWEHKGSGRWCRKIRGRFHYFGLVADDPNGQAALDKWLREKDWLLAGKAVPQFGDGGPTVRQLANAFLNHHRGRVDRGEIVPRTFRDLYSTCETIILTFGADRPVCDLKPDDFAKLNAVFAAKFGHVSRKVAICRTRMLFKFGYDQELIEKTVRYGQGFKVPSAKVIRRDRAAAGEKMYEAAEIRLMLDKAEPTMKAMILLATNAALGNFDVSSLPISAVDLENGWLDFPRPKTGVPRRCKLWPETVAAIREVLTRRKQPKNKDDKDILFLTQQRTRYVRASVTNPGEYEKARWIDALALRFGKFLTRLGLKRPGMRFYSLRHTFRTVADETLDRPAIDRIMGHTPPINDMGAVYRERIADERLERVAEHVRKWLFAKQEQPAADQPRFRVVG